MRIAIIGGNSEDERHLGHLAEKVGQAPSFVRSRAGGLGPSGGHANEPGPTNVLEHVVARLERAAIDEAGSCGPQPLRALVFEALDRADAAVRCLATARRDPYFDRVGALIILQADQARTIALPGGFDDFVLYPCAIDELLLRIDALGQRRSPFARAGKMVDEGIVVDETSRDVVIEGRTVQLTAREFALFTYLCQWRGKVLSREHLLARVWGSRYSGGRRTVDIHVRRLRAKLGASLAIETLRGSGYRLRHDPLDPASVTTAPPAFSAQMPEPLSKVS